VSTKTSIAAKALIDREGYNAELLNIDGGGIVTAPNQPAFWGFSQTINGSGVFTNYEGAPSAHWLKPGLVNTGSFFNTGTGLFTAPVTGRYHITGGMHSYDNTSTRKIMNLIINGVFKGEFCETTGPYDDQSTSVILNLTQNDTVCLGYNSSFNAFNASFGGYLIG